MSDQRVRTVLSIAGSDSGGGAGIQADLKAFARCGVHGATAITALTAQNTLGVIGVHPVPGSFIVEQVRAVADDITIDAVKIGMLGTAAIVEAVAEALDLLGDEMPVVLDPVMVAESGAVLLDESARSAVVQQMLPRATVMTPNLPEARVLAQMSADSAVTQDPEGADEVERLARQLHGLGPHAVVITGGHREELVDIFFDGYALERIGGERHPDGSAHGSGCTHSSVLAAHLALGFSPLDAARKAKEIAADAVRDGLRDIGTGAGPADVFGLAGVHAHRHAGVAR